MRHVVLPQLLNVTGWGVFRMELKMEVDLLLGVNPLLSSEAFDVISTPVDVLRSIGFRSAEERDK